MVSASLVNRWTTREVEGSRECHTTMTPISDPKQMDDAFKLWRWREAQCKPGSDRSNGLFNPGSGSAGHEEEVDHPF